VQPYFWSANKAFRIAPRGGLELAALVDRLGRGDVNETFYRRPLVVIVISLTEQFEPAYTPAIPAEARYQPLKVFSLTG